MAEPMQLTPLEQTPPTSNHGPALNPEFSSQVDQAEPSETTIKESNTVKRRNGKVQLFHLRAKKKKATSVHIRAYQRIAKRK